MTTPATGMSAEVSFIVEEKHLAVQMGSGDTCVFATPMLVAGLESAAVAAIADSLPAGMTTVGIHLDVWHKAATPPGMRVYFHAKVTAISANGKKLTFAVEARDETGPIGHGTHDRVMVKKDDFEKNARAKRAPSA